MQVIPMFGTFLIGTVLVTCLVMVVLLVLPNPKPDGDPRRVAMPYVGVALLSLLIFLAAVGGIAASA